MNGATHQLIELFPHGLYPKYIKVDGSKVMSCLDDGYEWGSDNRMIEFIDFYQEIDDLTETPEEKEIFDNWPEERRIDIIATNGNTGEHYNGK